MRLALTLAKSSILCSEHHALFPIFLSHLLDRGDAVQPDQYSKTNLFPNFLFVVCSIATILGVFSCICCPRVSINFLYLIKALKFLHLSRLIIALALLYNVLGWSALSGVAVVLFVWMLNYPLARYNIYVGDIFISMARLLTRINFRLRGSPGRRKITE